MDGADKTAMQLVIIGLLEAFGTAILLVAINFSSGNALLIVMGILTGAVISGRLTGAHFNPAVTVAVFLAEKKEKMKGNIKITLVMLVS